VGEERKKEKKRKVTDEQRKRAETIKTNQNTNKVQTKLKINYLKAHN
jgi:hypothetical protein